MRLFDDRLLCCCTGVAQQQLLGRRKAAEFRELAQRHDWLSPTAAMPSDAAMAQALQIKAPFGSQKLGHGWRSIITSIIYFRAMKNFCVSALIP